jgi:hypothetical protein
VDIAASFENAKATVTRAEGSRGADGFSEGSTTTVLECRGDLQQSGRALEQRAAYYEAGDALFFARKSVIGAEPGDAVTIEHDDGRTLEMAVEEVMYDDDALLLSFDG